MASFFCLNYLSSLDKIELNKFVTKILVENKAINNLTEDIDIVITHADLTSRAKTVVKNPVHLSINNFMDASFYDDLIDQLKKKA